MIRHVVLMTFHDHADAPEAKARLEALTATVPTIRTLECDLDVLRADNSSDLLLITTHDDLDAMRAYQQHPDHLEVVAWLKPRMSARAGAEVEIS